jgi:hypothetical protein
MHPVNREKRVREAMKRWHLGAKTVRYYMGYRQVFGQISSYTGVFGLIWGSIGPES